MTSVVKKKRCSSSARSKKLTSLAPSLYKTITDPKESFEIQREEARMALRSMYKQAEIIHREREKNISKILRKSQSAEDLKKSDVIKTGKGLSPSGEGTGDIRIKKTRASSVKRPEKPPIKVLHKYSKESFMLSSNEEMPQIESSMKNLDQLGQSLHNFNQKKSPQPKNFLSLSALATGTTKKRRSRRSVDNLAVAKKNEAPPPKSNKEPENRTSSPMKRSKTVEVVNKPEGKSNAPSPVRAEKMKTKRNVRSSSRVQPRPEEIIAQLEEKERRNMRMSSKTGAEKISYGMVRKVQLQPKAPKTEPSVTQNKKKMVEVERKISKKKSTQVKKSEGKTHKPEAKQSRTSEGDGRKKSEKSIKAEKHPSVIDTQPTLEEEQIWLKNDENPEQTADMGMQAYNELKRLVNEEVKRIRKSMKARGAILKSEPIRLEEKKVEVSTRKIIKPEPPPRVDKDVILFENPGKNVESPVKDKQKAGPYVDTHKGVPKAEIKNVVLDPIIKTKAERPVGKVAAHPKQESVKPVKDWNVSKRLEQAFQTLATPFTDSDESVKAKPTRPKERVRKMRKCKEKENCLGEAKKEPESPKIKSEVLHKRRTKTCALERKSTTDPNKMVFKLFEQPVWSYKKKEWVEGKMDRDDFSDKTRENTSSSREEVPVDTFAYLKIPEFKEGDVAKSIIERMQNHKETIQKNMDRIEKKIAETLGVSSMKFLSQTPDKQIPNVDSRLHEAMERNVTMRDAYTEMSIQRFTWSSPVIGKRDPERTQYLRKTIPRPKAQDKTIEVQFHRPISFQVSSNGLLGVKELENVDEGTNSSLHAVEETQDVTKKSYGQDMDANVKVDFQEPRGEEQACKSTFRSSTSVLNNQTLEDREMKPLRVQLNMTQEEYVTKIKEMLKDKERLSRRDDPRKVQSPNDLSDVPNFELYAYQQKIISEYRQNPSIEYKSKIFEEREKIIALKSHLEAAKTFRERARFKSSEENNSLAAFSAVEKFWEKTDRTESRENVIEEEMKKYHPKISEILERKVPDTESERQLSSATRLHRDRLLMFVVESTPSLRDSDVSRYVKQKSNPTKPSSTSFSWNENSASSGGGTNTSEASNGVVERTTNSNEVDTKLTRSNSSADFQTPGASSSMFMWQKNVRFGNDESEDKKRDVERDPDKEGDSEGPSPEELRYRKGDPSYKYRGSIIETPYYNYNARPSMQDQALRRESEVKDILRRNGTEETGEEKYLRYSSASSHKDGRKSIIIDHNKGRDNDESQTVLGHASRHVSRGSVRWNPEKALSKYPLPEEDKRPRLSKKSYSARESSMTGNDAEEESKDSTRLRVSESKNAECQTDPEDDLDDGTDLYMLDQEEQNNSTETSAQANISKTSSAIMSAFKH